MTPERNSIDKELVAGKLMPEPVVLGRILAAVLRIEDLIIAAAPKPVVALPKAAPAKAP